MTYNQQRLQQRIAELQGQWELLGQTLSHLQEDKILETRSEERLRLEHQIARYETERSRIEQQLTELENQLSQAEQNETTVEPPLEPPPSAPLSPNPFGDKGRITAPERFFGREELLRQILEELNKGVNVSLVGEAAVGKSSLLSMICEQSTSESIYFNMEWIDNEGEFYDALCEELGLESCRGFKLTRALRGRRVILCLDEIEKMAWEDFTVKVRSHIRGLADGPAAPLKLVIASRSPLDRLFPDSQQLDSPFEKLCFRFNVAPFSPEVAREFLSHRLEGTGITFTEEQIDELIAQTEGHPAKLQEEAAKLYRTLIMGHG